MKTSYLNFNLPKQLISEYPINERDKSRLMVIHRSTGKIEHKIFKNIIDYFKEGDIIILNNTKVIPAKFYVNKKNTNAKIEVFLLRVLDRKNKIIDVLVDPARKIRIGNKIVFGDSLVAEVIDNTNGLWEYLIYLILIQKLYQILYLTEKG
jgi:S-adenosylmethionine:tRNA ribosyltransferase-isomerase